MGKKVALSVGLWVFLAMYWLFPYLLKYCGFLLFLLTARIYTDESRENLEEAQLNISISC